MSPTRRNSLLAERPAILVVDDRRENLIAMKVILADVNAELVTADSGERALREAMRRDFALILMDVRMPGIDGFETAEMLRINKSTQAVPLILVTANDRDERYLFRGYECGAVDFLYAPLRPELLLAKVRVFLELYDRQKELERSNRALAEFAFVASHDLRAPARHIDYWVDTIVEDYGGQYAAGVGEKLDEIQHAARRMLDLVDRLLAYAKLGAAPVPFGPVELGEVVDNVLIEFEGSIVSGEARVDVGVLPCVRANPPLLHQLFQNLFDNALKYHSPGARPEIRIGAEPLDETWCRVFVSDNGIGFDPRFAERIFEPLRRLVAQGEYEGTGLGMASARKIAELHGGTLSAEGRPGAGATFSVTLPLAAPPRALKPSRSSAPVPRPPASSLSALRSGSGAC